MVETLPVLPSGATALFVGVVIAVVLAIGAGAWIMGLSLGFPRSGARRLADDVVLGLLAWLALTGLLASRGFFSNFDAMPPRLAIGIVVPLLPVFVLVLSRKLEPYLLAIPLTWLIAIQAFRLPIEVVVWKLAKAGVLPTLRTFEGASFDVLIGATAPIIAYLSALNIGPRRVAGWWNFIGILMLVTAMTITLLSAPSPWQVLATDPPSTLQTRFPFIWIPVFLVPFAMLCHLLSLRIIARQRLSDPKRESQPRSGALR